jgi:2-dehydropantoate 2-reductase
MKILVFGAGALGTLFAARLAECGGDVTILARGARLEAIRRDGLVLRHRGEPWRAVPVACPDVVHAEDYDLILACSSDTTTWRTSSPPSPAGTTTW